MCWRSETWTIRTREKYVEYQQSQEHKGLCVKEKGFVIDYKNPFLAASVDGEVTDPTNTNYPVGNLELKYKVFPVKIYEESNDTRLLATLATKTKNFCLDLTDSGLKLKKKTPLLCTTARRNGWNQKALVWLRSLYLYFKCWGYSNWANILWPKLLGSIEGQTYWFLFVCYGAWTTDNTCEKRCSFVPWYLFIQIATYCNNYLPV